MLSLDFVGGEERAAFSRVAPKRALWTRDKGCSFPGCTHTRFVDAHHMRHWSEGGETSIENTSYSAALARLSYPLTPRVNPLVASGRDQRRNTADCLYDLFACDVSGRRR